MKKKMLGLFTAALLSVCFFSNTVFADYYTEQVTLKSGMSGVNVTELQKDLRDLGYFHYNTTGYFGNLTRQAVINYQRDNYLFADGIVGKATSREIKTDKVVQTAKSYMGVPYVWGGTSPSGFDCSGFTHYAMLQNGIVIPRVSSSQYEVGLWISKSNLKPGDLVFFSTYKPGPSHVGIYLGNGQFIHASSGAKKVVISDLNKDYYRQRYIGARRVIR